MDEKERDLAERERLRAKDIEALNEIMRDAGLARVSEIVGLGLRKLIPSGVNYCVLLMSRDTREVAVASDEPAESVVFALRHVIAMIEDGIANGEVHETNN